MAAGQEAKGWMSNFSFQWNGHQPAPGTLDPSLQGLGDTALSSVCSLILNRPCYRDAPLAHRPCPQPELLRAPPFLNPALVNSVVHRAQEAAHWCAHHRLCMKIYSPDNHPTKWTFTALQMRQRSQKGGLPQGQRASKQQLVCSLSSVGARYLLHH